MRPASPGNWADNRKIGTLTWLLVLEYLPVGLEGVWQRRMGGRASGQPQVCRPRGRGSVPRPARGLAIEHPQLVIHRVGADLVVPFRQFL